MPLPDTTDQKYLEAAEDYPLDLLGRRRFAICGSEPRVQNMRYPVCTPTLGPREEALVADAVRTSWISGKGKYVQQFEEMFAAKVGAKYGCATNSGFTALHLALHALGAPSYDPVIMPTFTMIATANAAKLAGHSFKLTDCDKYYAMDYNDLGLLLQKGDPAAIMPVPIYGHPVAMNTIEAMADGVPIIYDNAEAHGALYRGEPIGGRGLASCYSFFGNKTITTGEGGMVVSNDRGFIDLCRNLADVAFSPERHFWHRRLGVNYRMTNMQAAIGVAQCERFDELVGARMANGRHYRELLSDVAGLTFHPQAEWATSSHWMVGVEVNQDSPVTRDRLRYLLAARGIETRTYFIPLHLQPVYADPLQRFPESERLASQGLYLPSSSSLTAEDREWIAQQIREVME